MGENIFVEKEANVARVILDKPPVNVIDLEVMTELNSALEPLVSDSKLRVIVISSRGKVFCAGMAVEDHTQERAGLMMDGFEKLFLLLRSSKAATIAAVQGAALGGGFELAMGCDLVVASKKAKFGQPEIQLGFFSPLAAVVLPQLVGRPVALEVFLTGEPMDAERAYTLGAINKVLPHENFEQGVEDFVKLVARHSAPVIELNKRVTDTTRHMQFADALAESKRLFLDDLFKLSDTREGLAAFFEKRKPSWGDE
ncbi:MAG: enoyl-CoA hydratase/isomerase family protein [Deltaproteobacteria bacterium]|nr:enoyl-CoA hydratase/isomerase family protein [Deltaproteobacteria bacterium]